MLAAEGDHRPATPQLVIQLLLPVPPSRDADLGIEVEKDTLVALSPQPGGDPLSPSVVLAAVADEDRAHRAANTLENHNLGEHHRPV